MVVNGGGVVRIDDIGGDSADAGELFGGGETTEIRRWASLGLKLRRF